MEGLETELLGGEKVEEEPQMRLETDPNHPNYNTMQPVV
jgi:hypothetical protein